MFCHENHRQLLLAVSFLLLFLLLGLLSGCASSGGGTDGTGLNQIVAGGNVSDASGEPLEGATVTAETTADMATAVSDEMGNYESFIFWPSEEDIRWTIEFNDVVTEFTLSDVPTGTREVTVLWQLEADGTFTVTDVEFVVIETETAAEA